ncbi:MAG: VOC family protein [Cytophagaceae bacterium]|nr:VOC family protein [Cytophagaceae bacterium]
MAKIKSNQKITACLWFDNNAEQAVKFYTGVFKNSKIGSISYYSKGTQMPVGTVLTIHFQIEGQKFLALNGGPYYHFTEAVSFVVNCKTQKEVDYYWGKLSKGGAKVQCGWLKDKYGVSWQIVPEIIDDMITDKDPQKSTRVMQAILKMKKLYIKKLEKAYKGK